VGAAGGKGLVPAIRSQVGGLCSVPCRQASARQWLFLGHFTACLTQEGQSAYYLEAAPRVKTLCGALLGRQLLLVLSYLLREPTNLATVKTAKLPGCMGMALCIQCL